MPSKDYFKGLPQTEADFVARYQGRKMQPEELTSYENWALDFFHQEEFVREPYLQMTLQVDITQALATYRARFGDNEQASFTSYLMWHLVQTSQQHHAFRYRKLSDGWYLFDNLPVFAPIAVGGEARFSEVLLEDVAIQPLDDFFGYYRSVIKAATFREEFAPLPHIIWACSHFIGNLPNLQFSAFTLHMPRMNFGRPFFYFGKRYQQGNPTMIPLTIAFDHANLDPFVLSAFMEDFERGIAAN